MYFDFGHFATAIDPGASAHGVSTFLSAGSLPQPVSSRIHRLKTSYFSWIALFAFAKMTAQ
jgi:hypothetical protein